MDAPQKPPHENARDWMVELGEKLLGEKPAKPKPVPKAADLPGFPDGIPVDQITYQDWSHYVEVQEVYVARVADAADVVKVCNWAASHQHTVRPMGASHNWSPLLLPKGTPAAPPVILVDTSQLVSTSFAVVGGVPQATFGTGITMEAATAYLETQNNGGAGAAPGYAFPNVPAPGHLTIGGVLAIGGHGTLVPTVPAGGQPDLMGGLSNLILSFDAVVTKPGTSSNVYNLETFDRSDADAAAFLVHLGRAFITSVTLRVVPNYYLQLTCLFPEADDLFAPPSQTPQPKDTFANLLDDYGRVEVLWFPYQSRTFAQCNKEQPNEIQPQVAGPYNFPWMNISELESDAIAATLKLFPHLTPAFTGFEFYMAFGSEEGTVLNGTARDLQIYLKDTTLKVTLFGWALQIARAEVQDVASQFYDKVQSLLKTARASGSYPVNAAMEIRCTTIDTQVALGAPNAKPPTLAATHSVEPTDPALDTVIWLNVGTIPETPGSFEFFTELEDWLVLTWGSSNPIPLRPEWSKAFAWSNAGPWQNSARLPWIRKGYDQPANAPQTFAAASATLASYDNAHIFTNQFLDNLFV